MAIVCSVPAAEAKGKLRHKVIIIVTILKLAPHRSLPPPAFSEQHTNVRMKALVCKYGRYCSRGKDSIALPHTSSKLLFLLLPTIAGTAAATILLSIIPSEALLDDPSFFGSISQPSAILTGKMLIDGIFGIPAALPQKAHMLAMYGLSQVKFAHCCVRRKKQLKQLS